MSAVDDLDDVDFADEDMHEIDDEPRVCVLGDRCVCPHIGHSSDECATAESVEAYEGDTKRREPGCRCDREEGDSPCPVHGDESDGR